MLVIISGPSGVGKTTITHHVERAVGAVFSVSMTTRPQSADDAEAQDYFFVDQATFEETRADGGLLEWAEVFGNYYGTPRAFVEENLEAGRVVILEIDVAGAEQVKRNMPDAWALFVLPPSEDALLDRLRNRAREDEAVIQRRFAKAKDEIARAKASGVYDAFIVNDTLDHAKTEAVELLRKELTRCGQS